jgi:hypothetical protein
MEASQSLRQAGTEITSTDHLYHSAHADRVLRLRRRLRRLFSFCSMLLFYSLTLCSWQPVLALNQLNSLPVAAVEQDRGQQVNNVHLVDHRWLRNGMLDPFDVQFSLLNSLSDGVAVSNLVLQADVLVALSALSQQGEILINDLPEAGAVARSPASRERVTLRRMSREFGCPQRGKMAQRSGSWAE